MQRIILEMKRDRIALLTMALLFIAAMNTISRAEDPQPPVANQEELERFKRFIAEQAEKTTPTPIPQRGQTATKGSMRIRIVDADRRAMPGAKVHSSIWTQEKNFKANHDCQCNAQGQVDIELPKTIEIVRIWARQEGYVLLWTQWWPDQQIDGDQIPDEFTFRLPKGTTIGGVIRDADGKPIQGVKVEASLTLHNANFNGQKQQQVTRPEFDIWLAEDDTARITNAEGRWSLDNVPEGHETNVLVKLTHPDYISDATWGDLQHNQSVNAEDLKAQTAAIVMQRGIRVTGKLTDPDGKPVEGAVVIWGDRPYWEHRPQQEVHTDKEGTYRLPPLLPGPMMITVVAKGWMPQMEIVDLQPEMQPVDFQMKPGQTLRIRFVGSNGAPVPKVGVQIVRWRDKESLYNMKHPNVVETKIPKQADAHGVYEWTWAPDDPVSYSFGTQNFHVPEVTITADGQEHTQTVEFAEAK